MFGYGLGILWALLLCDAFRSGERSSMQRLFGVNSDNKPEYVSNPRIAIQRKLNHYSAEQAKKRDAHSAGELSHQEFIECSKRYCELVKALALELDALH